jgi:hypothetical protein
MKHGRQQVQEGAVCHRPWISEHPIMSFFLASSILGNLVVMVRGYNR